MNVLRLGNSDDLRADIPVAQQAHSIVAAHLSEATGEQANVVTRIIWPAHELPDLIDSWIGRYRPDIVQLGVNGFWYIYRSVPLQLERKLGRFGNPFANFGYRAGNLSWLNTTPPYHWARTAMLKTVGGATYFEVDEIVELVEACLRRILRHEDVSIILKGQLGRWASDPARDYEMYEALRKLSDRLHVPYLALDPRTEDANASLAKEERDRLHFNLDTRQKNARREADCMLQVWRERCSDSVGRPG